MVRFFEVCALCTTRTVVDLLVYLDFEFDIFDLSSANKTKFDDKPLLDNLVSSYHDTL